MTSKFIEGTVNGHFKKRARPGAKSAGERPLPLSGLDSPAMNEGRDGAEGDGLGPAATPRRRR